MNTLERQLLQITQCFRNHLDVNVGLKCDLNKNNSCANAKICEALNFIFEKGKEAGIAKDSPQDDPSVPYEHCKLNYSANSCPFRGVTCNNCNNNSEIAKALEELYTEEPSATEIEEASHGISMLPKFFIEHPLHKFSTTKIAEYTRLDPAMTHSILTDLANEGFITRSMQNEVALWQLKELPSAAEQPAPAPGNDKLTKASEWRDTPDPKADLKKMNEPSLDLKTNSPDVLPNCPECGSRLVHDALNNKLLCPACGESIALLTAQERPASR